MGEWHDVDSGCIASLDQFFSSRNGFGLKAVGDDSDAALQQLLEDLPKKA
jgi:hypothetical protein